MGSKRNRNIAIGALVAVALAVAVYLLAAGGSEQTRYGDRGSPEGEGAGRQAPPPRAFGETVRLKTYLTTIEVTPTAFARLAASDDSGPGVGVDVTIRNVGRATYRDQPMQAASVTLRRGGEADRVYEPVGDCAGLRRDTVRIRPGATRRYCLPFEATGRPGLFVYAPEAGLPGEDGAPEAAAWAFSR